MRDHVDMGTFRTECKIENPVDRKRSAAVADMPVDTGRKTLIAAGPVPVAVGDVQNGLKRTFNH